MTGEGAPTGNVETTVGRSPETSKNRLVEVVLDEASIGHAGSDVEHERATAIWDLVEDNRFAPCGSCEGPFRLRLGVVENRLAFEISTADGRPVAVHLLSLTPFRRIVKDYFFVCDSYYTAIRTAAPSKIEAIDMGRRGLHDEGSHVLLDRLKGKIDIDFATARRLFTLICALRWKG
jgi:uncharacterized protein (UPF0262 family)